MTDPMTDKAAAEAFTEKNRYQRGHGYSAPRVIQKVLPSQYSRAGCKQCWGEVTDNSNSMITHWFQCTRVGKTELADGSTWCGIHEPKAVAKRAAERAARWAATEAGWAAKRKTAEEEAVMKAAFPRFLNALRAIEAGDNDPRTTAREALGDFLEPKETI